MTLSTCGCGTVRAVMSGMATYTTHYIPIPQKCSFQQQFKWKAPFLGGRKTRGFVSSFRIRIRRLSFDPTNHLNTLKLKSGGTAVGRCYAVYKSCFFVKI